MTATSAKPLFRAMKPKPRRGAMLPALDAPEAMAPATFEDTRRAEDFYPTGEPEAIRALLARDGDRLRKLATVWEPAVGDGALAREIEAFGMTCLGTDIVDRGWPGVQLRSFYDFDRAPGWSAIITNPPYSEINARDGHGRWLRHTLSLPGWRYCALLLSWDWPAAKANGLGELLDAFPFSYCYLMRWKLDFTGKGSPPQRNAWFVWDRDWTGAEPAFRWLDRADVRQADMFAGPPATETTESVS